MVMDQAITLIDSMFFASRNHQRSPLQSSQNSTILSHSQDFVRSDVTYSQCSTRSRNIADLPANLPPDPLSGIVVSFQDLTAAEPRMVHILVAFTWLSESPTISRSVKIREDVRTADKRLMRMLYKIGNRFLNADVLIPDREGSENFSYMNFNSLSDKFYHSDDYGF